MFSAPRSFRRLVLLKPGTGTPLCIVHGQGGTAMELVGLARRIRANCPIYALQARGFFDPGAPHETIEAMAAEYLAELRLLQPCGPYLLAGYSLGGLIAYEMALRLQAAGEEIALLGLLDTTVHQHSWPLRAWLEFFVRRLRTHAAGMRRLKSSELMPFFRHGVDAFTAQLKLAVRREVPPDRYPGGPLPPPVQRVRAAALRAMTAYRPRASRLNIALFRTEPGDASLPDPKLIWNSLAGKVEVYHVAGDHLTMIRPPHVVMLAREMSRCLHQLTEVEKQPLHPEAHPQVLGT